MDLKQALAELRKQEKKQFDQSIDFIVNLKGVDVKKDNISTIVTIPNKIKDKKVCGFLTKQTSLVKTITQPEFARYKDKKPLKELVKEYDFFIAVPTLMPQVATAFGKALGPTGKMPSPQLGVVMKEEDAVIKALIEKINHSIKIRVKEASIKVSIGKESMSDDKLIANIEALYAGVVAALPTKKENVKSLMIKTTMGAPIKLEIK